jgi:hypothetical protein
LESRTAPAVMATSTQLDTLLLRLLFRQRAPLRSSMAE